MNDRVSQQPPSHFLHEEQAMEDYVNHDAIHNARASEDTDFSSDPGTGQSKPSGMYRFGKALANVFNPSMVWHGMRSGIWNNKVDEANDDVQQIMQDRKARAEKAYAELKNSGYYKIPSKDAALTSTDIPIKEEMDCEISQSASQRDSGIDVGSYRSSDERKREDTISDLVVDQEPLPVLSTSELGHLHTPTSEEGSTRHALRSLSKPSLRSLKKVKSHFTLPSSKRRPASPIPSPSAPINEFERQVVKKQSRKELQKQQKLNKKISSLENQLEKARRDLQISGQQTEDTDSPESVPATMSTRKSSRRFVPGALPALPSESVINYNACGKADDNLDDAFVTPSRPYRTRASVAASRKNTTAPALGSSTNGRAPSLRKRKAENGGSATTDLPEMDENSAVNLDKAPKLRSSRQRKAIKAEEESPAFTNEAGPKGNKRTDSFDQSNSEHFRTETATRLHDTKAPNNVSTTNPFQSPAPFLPPPISSTSFLTNPKTRSTRSPSVKENSQPSITPPTKMKPTSVRVPSPSPVPTKGKGDTESIVTITPSGGKDGVPPVPKVPESLEGKRVKIRARNESGRMVRNGKDEMEWMGWDEDVF